MLASLLDALARRKTSLAALAKDGGPELTAAIAKLDSAFAQARKTAADPKAPLADRLTAIRLVGRGPGDTAAGRALLADLLGPQSASDVQSAAVAALARSDATDTPAALAQAVEGIQPRGSRRGAVGIARPRDVDADRPRRDRQEGDPAGRGGRGRPAAAAGPRDPGRARASGQAARRRDRRGSAEGDRSLPAGFDANRRPRARQAGLRQELCRVPQGRRRRQGTRPGPVGADRQVGRLPAGQPSRSEPGGRGPLRFLHGPHDRRAHAGRFPFGARRRPASPSSRRTVRNIRSSDPTWSR